MTAYSLTEVDAHRRAARGAPDRRTIRAMIYAGQAALDVVALAIGFGAADLIRHGEFRTSFDATLLPLVLLSYLAIAFIAGVYTYEAVTSAARALGKVVGALAVTLAVDLLILFALQDSDEVSRIVFFAGGGLSLVLLVAGRIAMTRFIRRLGSGALVRRILVTDGRAIDAPPGFELFDAEGAGIVPDLHNPLMLNDFSRMIEGADRVIVSCAPERREQWSIYLKGIGCRGELLVPELHGVAPLHDEPHLGLVGIRVSAGPLDLRKRTLKRLLDVGITVPAIVLLTPLFLMVAVAVKLDSAGPVLFRQRRIGRSNRLFDIYKFRSMRVERSDHDGARSASRDDDRITRVGRFIRATSIDELPQLFNVLEGDMSLVGPRPHALGSLARDQLFWQVDQRYWLRHSIKPGITGLAQVRGFRGATDRPQDLVNRLRCDLEYVANWTLFTDVAILGRTLKVLTHRNAF